MTKDQQSAPVDAVVMASASPPKERPILFSGAMVRAILDGRKTQTRRIIKPQFGTKWGHGVRRGDDTFSVHVDIAEPDGGWKWIRCPYGKPGDRLWVREAWAVGNICDGIAPSKICEDLPKGPGRPPCGIRYPASQECVGIKCRPSTHMPRWASRLTLEITGVRAERLNEIREEDAVAEGIETSSNGRYFKDYGNNIFNACLPVFSFASLWKATNGAGSWDANPWVWVVEFKRLG